MTSFSQCFPADRNLHRHGWLCSVALHTATGIVGLTILSGLAPSFEPDQFKWSVALIEAQRSNAIESRPAPARPVIEPVEQRAVQQARIIPQRATQAVEPTTHVDTINQTTSTTIAQAVQHHEVSQMMVPPTPQDRVVEKEPTPASLNPTVTSVVEPLTSQSTADPVVPQPSVEVPAQHNAEQMVASVAPQKAAPSTKADYGWLMKALLGRIDELKNYPVMARINHWEGKVILRAVIRDDGHVLMVDVQESSGRSILDNDAMETLKKASPLKLDQPLGKPQVAILMPISYSLR